MVTTATIARNLFLLQRRTVCRSQKPAACSASRHHRLRWQSTLTTDERKPFYITTPIFYVNAAPHVGHLYTSILADVLKRWHLIKNDPRSTLLTGTDEHGMKVQKAAEKADLTPKALCDQNAEHFQHLAKYANIAYDRFMRTTDPDHKTAVEHFWKELRHRDYIYESKHEGWYSVSDETFYPESQVHLILDPSTGRKFQASMETGKEVEWTSEVNYHFRLSAFKDRLLEHYEEHPEFIVPIQRLNFVKKEVAAGLQDLSVSRPSSRLHWGIRVPDDESQTIYVWLDALINYLTMTGYPWQSSNKLKDLWPPNVQIIGKDIVRFHTIYWPAFLMALDLPLPKTFLTHAHWTMNNEKMSKSTGNVVNPFMAIDRFGLDVIRYFMVHDGGIVDDAGYDNSYIVEKYQKGLQNGFGNLFTRSLRSNSWDVGDAINTMRSPPSDQLQPRAQTMVDFLRNAVTQTDMSMSIPNPRQALHTIMSMIYEANRFVADTEPWLIARKKDMSDEEKFVLHQTIFLMTETLRISAIMLQPFMPDKMLEVLDKLGVSKDRRTFEYTAYASDFTYGQGIMEQRMKPKMRLEGLVFPPLACLW